MTDIDEADFGKRIKAARCYRGLTLADSIRVTEHALSRLEAGVQPLTEGDQWALLKAVAVALHLPEQFFTVDFQSLAREESPESKLVQYEALIERLLGELARLLDSARHEDCCRRRIAELDGPEPIADLLPMPLREPFSDASLRLDEGVA
jgi:transcriptional regulator with XRE-family HTH domain